MGKRKIMVLPGSSGRAGSERYEGVYATIERGAEQKGFKCLVISYPGQSGETSGRLNYSTAYNTATVACRQFQPDWIIGRSFGCVVAVGTLGSGENWVKGCEGAVLWGPCFRATLDDLFPTVEEKEEAIKGFREYDTFLAPDYFETVPAIENIIGVAQCNLRIARGAFDKYNTRQELDFLVAAHRQLQPTYVSEVAEVSDLMHEVIQTEVSPQLLTNYFDCLFDPIIARA
jgi:hypothetical protein